MALTKADIGVIYVCCKVLGNALPYEDEIFDILEKCRKALGHSAADILDEEVQEYFTDGTLKDFCAKIR